MYKRLKYSQTAHIVQFKRVFSCYFLLFCLLQEFSLVVNEAPETIGVASSSDRDDLDHDDLSDSSCAEESDVDIQL